MLTLDCEGGGKSYISETVLKLSKKSCCFLGRKNN